MAHINGLINFEEIRTEQIVTPVKVEAKCPVCPTGKMKAEGSKCLTSKPPKYSHLCDNPDCGHTGYAYREYPAREWIFEDKEPTKEVSLD